METGSRRQRRMTQRKSNNRKGNGLVVTRIGALAFTKYKIVKQMIGSRLIVHAMPA